MNFNYASQHQGVLAWSGTVAAPIDIRQHIAFSFTFEATADLAAETIFNIQSAPPSDADPCLPGTFVPVPEVLSCVSNWGAAPGPQASIHLPAGTKKGSLCTAALPCRPDAFVQLAAAGGSTANVRAVAILSGPK